LNRRRFLGVVVVFSCVVGLWGTARGEESPGLYDLTAHSDLVIAARVLNGSLKLAQVLVEEVFRGAVRPGQRLQIEFRDLNTNLGKTDRILFNEGETDILFLMPEVNAEGKSKGKDRYTLCRGRFGKFTLPREGEEVFREAIREFARLTTLKDHHQLFAELRGFLGSPNPLLVDVGLGEVARLQLMDREMVPEVMPFLQDPSPRRRIAALLLLAKLSDVFRDRASHPEVGDTVLGPLQTLARNDPEEEVRVAAVEALGAWGGEMVEETLQEIARQDAAQAVRYRAQVILFRESKKEVSPDKAPTRAP